MMKGKQITNYHQREVDGKRRTQVKSWTILKGERVQQGRREGKWLRGACEERPNEKSSEDEVMAEVRVLIGQGDFLNNALPTRNSSILVEDDELWKRENLTSAKKVRFPHIST